VASSSLSREEPDTAYSIHEERVKLISWSSMGRVLVVIVSIRGLTPQIISARRATKRERDAYIG
jgi:uncharacterized DUF497 family protein